MCWSVFQGVTLLIAMPNVCRWNILILILVYWRPYISPIKNSITLNNYTFICLQSSVIRSIQIILFCHRCVTNNIPTCAWAFGHWRNTQYTFWATSFLCSSWGRPFNVMVKYSTWCFEVACGYPLQFRLSQCCYKNAWRICKMFL
jgi:hypothetical protein